MEAGLPNITGTFIAYTYSSQASGGCFSNDTGSTWKNFANGTGIGEARHFAMNAFSSSSIYGNSSTVAPLSQSALYIMKY